MAVKQHELVHHSKSQVTLALLAQYIQLLNEQPDYLPNSTELVKCCKDIVTCLAESQIPRESDRLNVFLAQLNQVQEFFQTTINNVSQEVREKVTFAVLQTLYSIISDPKSDACPAACIVLTLMSPEDVGAAVQWLVKDADAAGAAGSAGLRSTLACLYRWLYSWQFTPILSHWVLAFIKGLERRGRFDVLETVSVDCIGKLFDGLIATPVLRQAVAPIVFHILCAMRDTPHTLDKIAPKIRYILEYMASDSGTSRQMLQSLVDITSALLLQHCSSMEEAKIKYPHVVLLIESHLTSKSSVLLEQQCWRSVGSSPAGVKIGLRNLGNTCYMNSVLQALLCNKTFANHCITKMNQRPYWKELGGVLVSLVYSKTTALNIRDFFELVRPPHFASPQQHDSSEFLACLLDLLHWHEGATEYYRWPCIELQEKQPQQALTSTTSTSCTVTSATSTSHYAALRNYDDDDDANNNNAAHPETESAPSSSRSACRSPSPKRRRCLTTSKSLHQTYSSYIKRNFSGVVMTTTQCLDCTYSSVHRELFRFLHLAFPEKSVQDKLSVQELIEFYCATEHLSGDNSYSCGGCHLKREAERTVRIEVPPPFLILVLKNFKYNAGKQIQLKLLNRIYQNPQISLPLVSPNLPNKYKHYASVIHIGTTPYNGHYYTLAQENDQWYRFNDDVVDPVTDRDVKELRRNSTPYILFYKRMDVEEGRYPTLDEVPEHLRDAVHFYSKSVRSSWSHWAHRLPAEVVRSPSSLPQPSANAD